jgi:hypothetical protein
MEENKNNNIKKIYNPHLKGNFKVFQQQEKEERIEMKVRIINILRQTSNSSNRKES